MRIGRLFTTASLLAVVSLGLAACHSDPGQVAAPRASSSSSVATTSPSPAATRPSLDRLTIGPDGIGDLVIGQPVPDVDPDVALVHWDPDICDTGDPSTSAAWAPSYPDVPAGEWGGPWPFGIATRLGERDAPIGFILVTTRAVGTAAGIHVGSTIAEVRAAYPKDLKTLTGYSSDVYYVAGARGTLQIEVPHDEGVVTALSSIPEGTAPFAMYGGDGGAPCSA